MDEGRIHRTKTDDGAEIAAWMHGQGPPLVFVHGGTGDGKTSWSALAPLLSDRFTCYLISLRGREPSGDHPDHSHERLVRDIVAFAKSIGEPVGLIGHSFPGALVLDAAARTSAVSALALYEPTLMDLGPRDAARDGAAINRLSEALQEGRSVDAVRIFLEDVALATDEELALLAGAGVFEAMARNLPFDLAEAAQSGLPQLGDLAVLERITTPVLLLHGSRTPPFYRAVVRAVADRLRHPQVREISGVAHLAPQVAPEPVARELAAFFAGSHIPA